MIAEVGGVYTGTVLEVRKDDPTFSIRAALEAHFDEGGELPGWVRRGSRDAILIDPPRVGDFVDIEFTDTDLRNDQHAGETLMFYGRWRWWPRGTSPTSKSKQLAKVFKDFWPERRGLLSREGHAVYMDDHRDAAKRFVGILHALGHELKLHPDGSVSIVAANAGNIDMTALGGNIGLTASGNVAVTAASVAIAAGVGGSVGLAAGAGGNVELDAAQVLVGTGADSPIARYTELASWAAALVAYLDALPRGTLAAVPGAPALGAGTAAASLVK